MLAESEARHQARYDTLSAGLEGINRRLDDMTHSATEEVTEATGAAENAADEATGALSEVPSESVEEADKIVERRRRYRRI